jgi:hypothetical protein
MKKLIMLLFVVICCAAASHAQGGKSPYTANYSSSFTIADPAYSEKVLMLWKDFENNALDSHIGWFADTVTMTLADGTTVKGKAENLSGAKAFRASLKDYKANVDAWVSLKSTDRNQNVVCIWGNEEYTDKDGKPVKHRIQEVWGFNKDGKIDLMLQYEGGGGM